MKTVAAAMTLAAALTVMAHATAQAEFMPSASTSFLADDPAPPDETPCPGWGWGPYFFKQKNIQSQASD